MNVTVKEDLENDEMKAQGLARIVNDDWPIIDEIAKKGFVVKTKKSKINIEEASSKIQQSSSEEDSRIFQQNQKDDNVIQQVRENYIQEEVEYEEEKVIVVKEKVEQTVEKTVNVIKPQNVSIDNSSTREEKLTLAKQIGVGLTHLFIVNATNLLKPINFVAQNFSKFFITLVHVLVPLAMALFLTQKIDFITTQLSKETATMNLVYFGVFYTASIFVWIFAQVLSVGIFSMIKRSLYDVAKIGKEKI